jgi:hypothetical protein
MAKRYKKRCLASLIIKEIVINQMRYHFTHFRMAVTKTQEITNVGENVWSQGSPYTLTEGM